METAKYKQIQHDEIEPNDFLFFRVFRVVRGYSIFLPRPLNDLR